MRGLMAHDVLGAYALKTRCIKKKRKRRMSNAQFRISKEMLTSTFGVGRWTLGVDLNVLAIATCPRCEALWPTTCWVPTHLKRDASKKNENAECPTPNFEFPRRCLLRHSA